MKKTILLIGLIILSLSAILTSCDDDDENVILTNNVITIGDAISPITSVNSKTENDATFIIINTDAMELIFEFDGKQSIPTGDFRLTFDGKNTGVLTMVWSGIEYVLIGDLSISKSNGAYTLNASGNAFSDYYTFVPFGIYYNGSIN
ncbi:MAG: hypothetical protein IKV80_04125 [Bacteroidales bacterium]|nr:hypothetical protein [Bacteroidales bacterium]MBR5604766.1 hypothetical protein [Bacteroidales bacterium]MBR5781754.1 hypothetical protein [Bacteroidales bacterium]